MKGYHQSQITSNCNENTMPIVSKEQLNGNSFHSFFKVPLLFNHTHCQYPKPVMPFSNRKFFSFNERISENTNQLQFPFFTHRVKSEFQTEKTQPKSSKQKTKESIAKLSSPPPSTLFKVIYFDPNNAPLLTSGKYQNVEGEKKEENKKFKNVKKQIQEQENQPESDSDPFIIYRFRRIKKKYKRHMEKCHDFDSSSENQDKSSDENENSNISESKNYAEVKIKKQQNDHPINIFYYKNAQAGSAIYDQFQ